MEVFRLQNQKHPLVLSGFGASISGARWNSKGTELIYTAQNRALSMAEVVVHLSLFNLPKGFQMLKIRIPDSVAVYILPLSELVAGWNSFPENSWSQQRGDALVRAKDCAVYKVPSAVVKGEFNFLINPHHPDFKRIKIIDAEDFLFDSRLFY